MKRYIDARIDKEHCYYCGNKIIARQNENNATAIRIQLLEEMLDKWIYIEFAKPNGEKVCTPKLEVENGVAIYDISNSLTDIEGELGVEIVIRDSEGVVWKSFKKTYLVEGAINAAETVEEGSPDFITEAQTLLDQVEAGLTPTIGENGNWYILDKDTGKTSQGTPGTPGKDGKDGANGNDGYSPKATVTETETGAIITITDENGTTTANVINGKDGKDGEKGEKGEKGDTGTNDYNDLVNKPNLDAFATKQYVDELIGGIENGSY